MSKVYALWFAGWSVYFATAGDAVMSYAALGVAAVFGSIRRA